MTGSLNIPVKKQDLFQPVNLLAAGYILVAIATFRNYLLIGSVNFMLGLLALPFAWKTNPGKKGNYRYGWVTLVLLILCFIMPVKTLLYFSIGFALLFFTEAFYGKTNLLALSVIVFASPVFQYLGDVFSFPIRLQLTRLAGWLFNLFGPVAEVKGNMIIQRGNEFSVDPACMGLSMITASLLSGIMLIGFFRQKFKRQPKTWVILFYLSIILLLNVVANLVRIVLLVQFNIQPDTLSHDIAGLGCLFLYVLLPAIGLAKFFVRRSPDIQINESRSKGISNRHVITHLFLLAAIVFLSFKVLHGDTFTRFKMPSRVDGYSLSYPAQGIVKLDKPGSLIYVKYIRGFYDTEHNPMICWTGGGYQFKNVDVEQIADRRVFTGTITNGADKFYSAWWYDNGTKNTTDQVEWRLDLLRGANHYVLVNISCPTKEELDKEVEMIIQLKTLTQFFSK
ncbi:MAG: exosortase N [Chitinophagales bacterium]